MMKRHDLSESMSAIARQYDNYNKKVPLLLENIMRLPDKYGTHASTCLLTSPYFAVLNVDKQEIWQTLELGACYTRANFISFFNYSDNRSFEYKGTTYEFTTTDKKTSHNDPQSWLKGFFASVISRRFVEKDFLLTVKVEHHYGGGVSMSEVYHKLVALLKVIYTNGQDAENQIREFLSIFQHPESANSGLDLNDPYNKEFFPKIFVPIVELYKCILTEAGKGFNDKFAHALEQHREFWTHEDRYWDYRGWLSLPLLAAAIFAEDQGTTVTFESEYTPQWLIKGELT